jgi:hypothetical protein
METLVCPLSPMRLGNVEYALIVEQHRLDWNQNNSLNDEKVGNDTHISKTAQ